MRNTTEELQKNTLICGYPIMGLLKCGKFEEANFDISGYIELTIPLTNPKHIRTIVYSFQGNFLYARETTDKANFVLNSATSQPAELK